MLSDSVTINELFCFLKINKRPVYDRISSNVIKTFLNELNDSLIYMFEKSLDEEFFSHALKIAKLKPFFQDGNPSNISKYRPISILPCFPKILKRIIYNCLYKYLTAEKLLY